MSEKRYIHIRQWDTFQHPDVTRNRRHAAPWIKQFTGQLSNEDYMALSYGDRGLLESLRIQYALNRGRGIDQDTSNLLRILGQRVRKEQLARLNDAGFIEVSASKDASDLQATPLKKTALEVDVERDTDVEGEVEVEEQEPHQIPPVANNGDGGDGNEEGEDQTFDLAAASLNTLKDIPF